LQVVELRNYRITVTVQSSALNIVRYPAIVLTDRFPIGTVSARVRLHRESADDDTGYTASACECEPDQLSALSP